MILDIRISAVAPEITVVELIGRMTLGNRLAEVEHSLRKLLEQGCQKLVIDLKHLDFLDSAGIGVLVMCAGQLRQSGGEMRLAGPVARIRQILDVAHISTLIPVFPDAKGACDSFSAGASA
jgi:anti-sigma B factor antagonist